MQAVAHGNDVAALHLIRPVVSRTALGAGPGFPQCDVLAADPAGDSAAFLFLLLTQSETIRHLAQCIGLNQTRGVAPIAGVDIEAASKQSEYQHCNQQRLEDRCVLRPSSG